MTVQLVKKKVYVQSQIHVLRQVVILVGQVMDGVIVLTTMKHVDMMRVTAVLLHVLMEHIHAKHTVVHVTTV